MKGTVWLSIVIWVNFTHAILHIMDVHMRNAQPRQEEFESFCRFSICRDCAEEVGCLKVVNWHMNLSIFVWQCETIVYCTESSWIRVLYEIVSWSMIYIIYDSGVFSFMLPGKTSVLCLIDLSSWYYNWRLCFKFCKNICRSDSIINSGI